MNLIPTTPKSLKSKSDSIISVFTKTITGLQNVNSEIENKVATNEEIIRKQQLEIEELNSIKTTNQNLLSKIENLLN